MTQLRLLAPVRPQNPRHIANQARILAYDTQRELSTTNKQIVILWLAVIALALKVCL